MVRKTYQLDFFVCIQEYIFSQLLIKFGRITMNITVTVEARYTIIQKTA